MAVSLLLPKDSKAENVPFSEYNKKRTAEHICFVLSGLLGIKEGKCEVRTPPDRDFEYIVDLKPKKITDFKKFQPSGLKNGIYSIKGVTPEYVWNVASIFTEEQKREICKSVADLAYSRIEKSGDVAYMRALCYNLYNLYNK